MHGGGVDGGRNVFEVEWEGTGAEMNLADVANESEAGVIDRDGKIGLILLRGGEDLLFGGHYYIGKRRDGEGQYCVSESG